MKRTKIKYKAIEDNYIQIVGFENVASYLDIEKEFGKLVRHRYSKCPVKYVLMVSGKGFLVVSYGDVINLRIGYVVSKDDFDGIIARMKEAGDNLQRIVKGVEMTRVKEILI